MSLHWSSVETRVGRFFVASRDGKIVLVRLPGSDVTDLWRQLGEMFPGEAADGAVEPVLARAAAQIQEYIDGLRDEFHLPLELHGTEFQKQVWSALVDIPFGETRSYAEVAEAIGKPGAARAVGGANRVNHLPLLVPCHRVIAADGGLGGYMGIWNAEGGLKARFLDLEKAGRPLLATP